MPAMKVDKLIDQNTFDARDFRNALGSFATGVTIVTAQGAEGHLAGLTVNSFASVSLDPPLVLWSLSRHSPALTVFRNCSHYAINVLAADQLELSNMFARSGNESERFRGLQFAAGLGGAPLLEGCCAWFECRNETTHDGGDHLLFVGDVENYRYQALSPLVFHGGKYQRLALP